MLGKTHFAGGMAAGAGVGLVFNFPMEHFLICCVAGGIGGLLPDIDSSTSTVTSHTGVAGSVISRLFYNRGILHTPFIYAVINGILWYVLFQGTMYSNMGVAVLGGLFAGEISHLLLDSLNHIGIMWLWPYPKRFSVLHVSSHGLANTVLRYLLMAVCICIIVAKIGWFA